MEQCSTDVDALYVISDLNDNEIENEELDGEDEPVPNEDEIQATSQVEFANLTVEELERKLEVNQVVENEHVAYALYNKYARMKGFSVRRGKGYNFNGCKLLRAKIFLCSCEGIKDESRSKNRLPEYQKTSFRCKCMARLRISRTMGGVWKIAKFVKEHTHELYAPDETYLLKSGRNMTNEQEVVLNAMRKSKIPIAKAFRLLENVSQGREHVGFTQRDAYNCVNRGKRKTKMENEDSIGLLQHFTRKANDELDFYCSIDKDDDNKLMNFFFRDRRCLIDYSKFNEVVTFDTTYRTNRYEMICAVFVGINHHNENVMFGCAFLSVFVSEAAQKVRELALRGKAHNETREILKKHIESAEKEMNAWFEKMDLNSTAPCVNMHINEVDNLADCYDVRDPGVAKKKGITIRHWDDKTKKKGKGKGKAPNSKTTKGPKQKVQKRNQDVNAQFSQGTLSAPQSEIPSWSWPAAYANANAPVGYVRPEYPQFPPLNPMTRFDGHTNMMHNVSSFGFVELLQGMEGYHEHASKTTK